MLKKEVLNNKKGEIKHLSFFYFKLRIIIDLGHPLIHQ